MVVWTGLGVTITTDVRMVTLAVAEFLLSCAAVYLAAFVRLGGAWPTETDGSLLWIRALVFGGVVVVALTAMGLYQSRQRLTIEAVLSRVAIGLLFAACALGLIYYTLRPVALWRGWWLLSLVIVLLLLCSSRLVFARVVDQDFFRRRVVVYGAGQGARSVLQLRRRSDQRGFQVMAFLPVPGENVSLDDPRVDRSPDTLLELARKYEATEIVVAMEDRRRGFPVKELLDCKFAGIDVIDILGFLERESGRVKIELLHPSWLIFSEGFTRRSSRDAGARMLDLAVSLALLLIAWPIMLATALAILLEDGRPVLYRQTRVGMLGREFELYKFRSMTRNAESEGGPQWAQRNDTRVTKVGALIRKLRIDELPQLFNVITGDMRIVGPRPERPEFVSALSEEIPYYHERHCVKPGVTGWAQLCYPYGSSARDALEKLQFDLYYVKNRSLIFDLMILVQTVEVVVWRKGAR